MKKITRSIFSFFILLILSNVGFSQDIHFSQWYNAPLYYNPANAGAFSGDQRVKVNYKDQWRSVTSPYQTFLASFDMPFLKKKFKTGFIGGGVTLFNDRAGDSKFGTTQANLSISARRTINSHNSISAGLVGGFGQKSINYSALEWGNQFDVTTGAYNSNLSSGESASASTAESFGDFGGGVLWNYGKGDIFSSANNQLNASAGVAFLHFNRPEVNFLGGENKIPSKFVAHASLKIGIGTGTSIISNMLYSMQGPFQEILPGFMVRYTLVESSRYTGNIKEAAISFGGQVRVSGNTADSFISTLIFEYAKYAIGISYDTNISGLSTVSKYRGGIELSFSFFNPNPFRYSQSARF